MLAEHFKPIPSHTMINFILRQQVYNDLLRCLEPNDAGVAYTNFTELQCFKDDSKFQRQRKKPDSVHIPKMETGSLVRAVFDFCPSVSEELPLFVGDIIEVLAVIDEFWLFGKKEGVT
ncbi:hypothetical protein L345_14489, partial [Ophiophagus hannah]